MHGRAIAAVSLAIYIACAVPVRAADAPPRKPLDAQQRTALLSLLDAVDRAQQGADEGAAPFTFEHHVIKSGDHTAYMPFRLTFAPQGDAPKAAGVYIRAVSRHDGYRAT
jgi:hypothetical protein